MGISIFDVSKYFLSKIDVQSGEVMTHLKLQKLTYYAQSYKLAQYGEKMFEGSFEAWAHGPVNAALYSTYKPYGYKPLPVPISINLDEFADHIKEILEIVWAEFGKYDAKHLEKITHQELPWTEARGDIPYGESCNNIINEETMKDYYKGLIAMGETKKPIKPLFTLDQIRQVIPDIDLSRRGSDEEYFDIINEELEEFKVLRERVGEWGKE